MSGSISWDEKGSLLGIIQIRNGIPISNTFFKNSLWPMTSGSCTSFLPRPRRSHQKISQGIMWTRPNMAAILQILSPTLPPDSLQNYESREFWQLLREGKKSRRYVMCLQIVYWQLLCFHPFYLGFIDHIPHKTLRWSKKVFFCNIFFSSPECLL